MEKEESLKGAGWLKQGSKYRIQLGCTFDLASKLDHEASVNGVSPSTMAIIILNQHFHAKGAR